MNISSPSSSSGSDLQPSSACHHTAGVALRYLPLMSEKQKQKQKSLFLFRRGGEFAVQLTDIPTPGPGELLVEIHATALNPADWKVHECGWFIEEYPTVLGTDCAGLVKKVGDGVTNFDVGDRVLHQGYFDKRRGTFQQYCIVPAEITAKATATIPLSLGTTAVGLCNKKIVPYGGAALIPPWEEGGRGKYSGQPFLIIGGSSSVGQHVIQLAKLSGFSPIITTASAHNREYVEALGATHVLDRAKAATPQSLASAVHGITTKPITVAFDAISEPATQTASYSVLAPHGKLIVVVLPPAVDPGIRLPFGRKKAKQHDPMPSQLSHQLLEEPPFNNGGTPAAEDDIEAVKTLCSMGFSRTQAVSALEQHDYDVQRALNSLLVGAAQHGVETGRLTDCELSVGHARKETECALALGGGPNEHNLSSYLLKPCNLPWSSGAIALEAGSGLGALSRILQADPNLFGNDPPSEAAPSPIEVLSWIRCYLITHAHMDHINGLVLSAGSIPGGPRRVYALHQTLTDIETVFSDRLWPNLATWEAHDHDDMALIYTALHTDAGYEPIQDGISVRTMPLSHGCVGPDKSATYDSTAFFIRSDASSQELLFFGDVEPDSVALQPRLRAVWLAAAPKIPQTLSTLFIECSFPLGRPDNMLYGHLSPEHLAAELSVLAEEVVKHRRISTDNSSPAKRTRKKQRRNPISPQDLRGALTGLRVFITHVKEDLQLQHNRPMHDVIAEQVRSLVDEQQLGVDIIAASQGMHIYV
ncbi:hypothetical protein NM688_g1456 [Phlebia brevispora]|uniref:Uncharacterized protein n=1 Tax=Phlebia brevispora TaxID=194682 RepID=A0ACC1TBF8_9APHY|nr:hypothetical protein NM688_g1456 [Phlebia brevispora]